MLIFSIIGTLIGAGFASGQEIYLFFYKYKTYGIFGLVLCSILISTVIYKTCNIIYTRKIDNYGDFLEEVFNSKKISNISNIIINAFLLITFYIMISGFGAYFKQQFQINSIIGSSILTLMCFIVLIKDIEGVKFVNSFIVPVLIVIIVCLVFLCFKDILKETTLINLEPKMSIKWILDAIIYCSYNMILVIPVLVNLSRSIKNISQILIVSVLSGFIVFILALSIFLILLSVNIDYSKIEMPVVYVINNSYPRFLAIYGIVILASIFSTAISIGISFLKNIAKNKKSYPQFVAIMCISGMLISNFGFSNLVKSLFPIFGYLGVVQIYYIFANERKIKKT